jgi:hypothetical protein
VERRPGDAQARGTHSDLELAPHTDLHDILALGTARRRRGRDSFSSARRTCTTRFGSGCRIICRRCAGYFFGTNPVLRSRAPVSAKVPVFAGDGDGVQCCFNPISCKPPRARGGSAAACVCRCRHRSARAGVGTGGTAQFRLSPGDVVLWHNWSWLHGRTAFEDDPEQRRLLLRLWLRSDLCPPADIRFAERSVAIDDDHECTRREGMRVE